MNVLYPEGITDGSQWLSAATPPEHEQQKSLADSEAVTDKHCIAPARPGKTGGDRLATSIA
jgi:hypothetical protein